MDIEKHFIDLPENIVDTVLDFKDSTKQDNRSNVNGWQSPQLILSKQPTWIKDLIASLPISGTVDKIWFNISGPGAYHNWHSHGHSGIIGVYYIKIPLNSGNIEFRNGNELLQIEPSEGLLIIFPKGTDHRVLTNESNDIRISLAFHINT